MIMYTLCCVQHRVLLKQKHVDVSVSRAVLSLRVSISVFGQHLSFVLVFCVHDKARE